MFKCEICHDWSSRIKITQDWWRIARNNWETLNGKDLPYFIAILTVLRETTIEIFDDRLPTSKNHSEMKEDLQGYSLIANKNCKFISLTDEQKKKWFGLRHSIRAFRNGTAHISDIQHMNSISFRKSMDSTDSTQDYYRYAPSPDLKRDRVNEYSDSHLRKIHSFTEKAILDDVRSSTSDIDSDRIKYEFYHVERGPYIDLLHTKIIELLKEIKAW